MRISIFSNVKSDRQFKATTGLSKLEFNELSTSFSNHYAPSTLAGFPEGFGNDSAFQDPSEALFFVLYHHKVNCTYDVLALSFGIARVTAHNCVSFFKKILKKTLESESVMPKRTFSSVSQIETYLSGVEEIFIDATESPAERPQNEDKQEQMYSKKK
jgi:hypothetical protein